MSQKDHHSKLFLYLEDVNERTSFHSKWNSFECMHAMTRLC